MPNPEYQPQRSNTMPTDKIFDIITPSSRDNKLHWANLPPTAAALAINTLATQQQQPLCLITPDIHTAQQYYDALQFLQTSQYPIYQFPDWETLPYDSFSPHQDLVSDRLRALYQLPNLTQGIVIIALPTLLHRLLPRDYLEAHSLVIARDDKLNQTAMSERLTTHGYHRVEQVMERGEYTVRGALLDLFPMGSPTPLRIEWFGDDIDSIREFDPETQCSIGKISQIELLPAREYPLTDDSVKHFRQTWRTRFPGNPRDATIYNQIADQRPVSGIEYYLPLFFDNLSTFFDYLPKNTQCLLAQCNEATAQTIWDDIRERHQQLSHDKTRPLCPPNELFLSIDEWFSKMNQFTQIHIQTNPNPEYQNKSGWQHFPTKPLPLLTTDKKNTAGKNISALNTLLNFINNFTGRILLCAESEGRQEILLDLLREAKYKPTILTTWQEFIAAPDTLCLTIAPLTEGTYLPDAGMAIITESELFGQHIAAQRRQHRARDYDPNTIIRNLTELSIGAPIVHREHGVGRYRGLQRITTDGIENEYIGIEYANEDKIYVPVANLDIVSRYTGTDSDHAPLHQLGSKKWASTKAKVEKQLRDVAAELLEIYAKREASQGHAFKKPDEDFQAFRRAFAFTETDDQTQTINAVINDMTKPLSMDRLVCGDVGFGKTEVAMQAAFLAVQDGKQVAVLVPTTLLASQHAQNFRDRFASWPIKIAELSRLRTNKEQEETLAKLKSGHMDIVIGTHKLLQPSIKFNNLGLLIVDEEHRFGVRQKEKIKALRAQVDILTLTATPIPRTLNMSLAGTRDLSLITTPPARRLAVKTFVNRYNPSILREAILRESMRGGQLYFLHNDIATLPAMAEKIQALAPQIKLVIAHGQMPERELEKVMSAFYHQQYNLLLCTTIIESGIDIPSANTIIINRADKFGLAQLHQLRGRVGRSHHQAYAYLFTPEEGDVTRDAEKRLDAIASLEELGAGFLLATHDLEIRGAGELLGDEQSGHIEAIGFSLYMEMLDEAVASLKAHDNGESAENQHAEVDLHISALIPETWVHDVHLRLTLYKRLADCHTDEDITELKAEMVDRFGAIPEQTQHLFRVASYRVQASLLGIKKIDVGGQFGYFYFSDKTSVKPETIITLIQEEPENYQLQSANQLRFKVKSKSADDKFSALDNMIKKLF